MGKATRFGILESKTKMLIILQPGTAGDALLLFPQRSDQDKVVTKVNFQVNFTWRLPGMLLPMAVYMGVEGRLRVVISVFDTMPRDVRDQCAGFRARPRSNHGFRGCMTTLTYVSCIVFDLIPSRFKVRDMFSAYVTCMVGVEHLFEDNF
ncbi:hypothetical protein DY000_02039662 [Brassica cretica]|uniref:Uncharacterized protein n=1 Tax=Brassica cretica TaxID=69181 RepID=A0ABQ7B7F3_BRACR|nr:hypothetical protein DY000_02039662 [Brassica cretica]